MAKQKKTKKPQPKPEKTVQKLLLITAVVNLINAIVTIINTVTKMFS